MYCRSSKRLQQALLGVFGPAFPPLDEGVTRLPDCFLLPSRRASLSSSDLTFLSLASSWSSSCPTLSSADQDMRSSCSSLILLYSSWIFISASISTIAEASDFCLLASKWMQESQRSASCRASSSRWASAVSFYCWRASTSRLSRMFSSFLATMIPQHFSMQASRSASSASSRWLGGQLKESSTNPFIQYQFYGGACIILMEGSTEGRLREAMAFNKYHLLPALKEQLAREGKAVPADLAPRLARVEYLMPVLEEGLKMLETVAAEPGQMREEMKMVVTNDKSNVNLYMESTCDFNLFNMIVVFLEMRYYNKWADEFMKLEEKQYPSACEKVSELVIQVPLCDAQFIHVYGTVVNRLDTHGELIVFARQVYDDYPLGKDLGANLKPYKADGPYPLYNVISLRKTKEGKVHYRHLIRIDVGINLFFVPNFVIRKALGSLGEGMYTKMKIFVNQLDKDYQDAVDKDEHGNYKWGRELLATWK